MTGSEYQKLAMRTNDGFSKNRLMDAIGEGEYHDIDVASLLMGCMGLAGESGELLDLIKKWVFHSKPLDEEHAKKELGDVLWYVAEIAHSMGWDLDEIMTMNIDKLRARYPEGFSTERSNHRMKTKKTLKDYLGKKSPLVESIVKQVKEDSHLLDMDFGHLPKPVKHKTDCYYYWEEQDMGARIPTCLREKWLGECPCENCDKYLSNKTIARIARIISGADDETKIQ